eukprot:TRINITY_DN1166_c1_g1_i1.p1 TRINITY_DN1166_c1_g1~~TRINITY_DN1166_c1_g1_i1.p1  ORF type:complete len:369 (+),score=88.40 TRINITY_DN1166_c1_g1_i1:176-1282(+)
MASTSNNSIIINNNNNNNDDTKDNYSEDDVIRLGFVEDIAGELETFPNKVGGKPVWLNPENPPAPLFCSRCNKPLAFLLQIYAPLDRLDHAYHRSFYLFCCLDGSCGTYNVVRIQLPQENKYYDMDGIPKEKVGKAPLCPQCGCFGEKKCSRCKQVFYCSKEHQAVDWRQKHKKECDEYVASLNSGEPSEKKSTKESEKSVSDSQPAIFLFKEMEIVTSEEPEGDDLENDNEGDSSEDRKELLQKYKDYLSREKSEGSVDVEDLPEMGSFTDGVVKQDHDPTFLKFQRRIAREKEQILRYTDSLFTQPLFVGEKGKPSEGDIPNCSHCGAKRSFEFQILPQLLYYLDVEKVLKADIGTPIIDWGTLLV